MALTGYTTIKSPTEIDYAIEYLNKMKEKMLEENQQRVKVGDIITIEYCGNPEDYMLCRISMTRESVQLCLIGLDSGNRWNRPKPFTQEHSHKGIPLNQFFQIFGINSGNFIGIKGRYKPLENTFDAFKLSRGIKH